MVTIDERNRFAKGRKFYNKPLKEDLVIDTLHEDSRSIEVSGGGPTFFLNIDKFDDHNYFTDTIFEGLELWPGIDPIFYPKKKCECGSSAVGSDKHSDYCPKHTSER